MSAAPPASQASTILELVDSYQKLIEERTALLYRRRRMITDYKRSCQKTDPELFTEVEDRLEVNQHALLGLRAALHVLNGGAAT